MPTLTPEAIVRLITDFNDALNARDVDTMMQLMTDDCVFENTFPAPDGTRYEGQRDVRKFWEDFFRAADKPHFEIEEIFATGNRCVMRWRYRWETGGERGHIRGVDVYTIHEGRIAEKLSYVKG